MNTIMLVSMIGGILLIIVSALASSISLGFGSVTSSSTIIAAIGALFGLGGVAGLIAQALGAGIWPTIGVASLTGFIGAFAISKLVSFMVDNTSDGGEHSTMDAIAMRTSAEAEAAAIAAKAKANAEAIRLEGEAKAEALKAQGLAEAEAMQKKADAYREYGQAALQAIVIEKLPEIAGSISKHLEGAKITAVNANATDQVTGLTTDLAVKAQELVKTFTGLDIADSLKSIASRDDHTVSGHDQTERAADHLSDGAITAIKDVKTTAADKTTD